MPMLYYVQELLDLFPTICGTYVCYNSERGLAFPSSACKPDKDDTFLGNWILCGSVFSVDKLRAPIFLDNKQCVGKDFSFLTGLVVFLGFLVSFFFFSPKNSLDAQGLSLHWF